jgi:hypothetical protein
MFRQPALFLDFNKLELENEFPENEQSLMTPRKFIVCQ